MVKMVRRISGGKAKNGITQSQAMRQAVATVGYLRPFPPPLKVLLGRLGGLRAGDGVDRVDRRGQRLTIVPVRVVQAVADEADDPPPQPRSEEAG